MLSSQVALRSSSLLFGLRQSIRAFSTPVETPKPAENPAVNPLKESRGTHKVDGLEKKMLVWTKKYKSVDEVPSFVTQEVMEKTRNK
jgi:hypothetical protein